MNFPTANNVTGLGALTGALNGIAADMRTDILGEGVKAAIQPVKVAAKRFAKNSEETGALGQSIIDKVVKYPANAKAVGLVGPDRGYYSNGQRLKNPLAILAAKNRRKPANYAHLLERGHIAKNGRLVAAQPIFRPALYTTIGAQGAAFFDGVGRGYAHATANLHKA